MSRIIPLDDAAVDAAAEALQAGSVVVLPVGGVYAIVADAFRPSATQRIFAARRRSRTAPLPVLIRSERQVAGLAGDVPEAADRLMAAFWPGELTLILPGTDGMSWDLGSAKGTVQLRRPVDDAVLRLIATVGPLACTAANRLDKPRPTTVQDAKAQLGVLVPLYVDDGERDGRVSTIVDVTGPSVVVAREGAIPTHHIHLVADGEVGWGERPADTAPAADGGAAVDEVDEPDGAPDGPADPAGGEGAGAEEGEGRSTDPGGQSSDTDAA